MKTNIALIGFMGTGKTSVGKILSKTLKMKLVGTDDLIVGLAGKSINEVFEQDGEQRFRKLEIEVVKRISDEKESVIDCGGGIVLNRVNINRLKKNAKIILLTASPEVVLKRVSIDNEERPLLNTHNRSDRIKKLLAFREPLYRESADFEINTSNLGVDQVVEKILEFLGKVNA